MLKAKHGLDGPELSLADMIAAENFVMTPKKWVKQPYCPHKDCQERVVPWDLRGAQGFRTLRKEVTARRQVIRLPGFNHAPIKKTDTPETRKAITCPFSFRGNELFNVEHMSQWIKSNVYNATEWQRNKKALQNEGVQTALDHLRDFLWEHLTGELVRGDEARNEVARIDKRMTSLRGIAEHVWTLPFMEALWLGERVKDDRRLHWDWRGEQKLLCNLHDGEAAQMLIPETLLLRSFRRDGPSGSQPNGGEVIPMEVPVTKRFALDVVKDRMGRQNRKMEAEGIAPPEAVSSSLFPNPHVLIHTDDPMRKRYRRPSSQALDRRP